MFGIIFESIETTSDGKIKRLCLALEYKDKTVVICRKFYRAREECESKKRNVFVYKKYKFLDIDQVYVANAKLRNYLSTFLDMMIEIPEEDLKELDKLNNGKIYEQIDSIT